MICLPQADVGLWFLMNVWSELTNKTVVSLIKKNIRGNMDFRFKVCIFCVKPLLITMIVTVLHCQVVCVTFVDISTYLIIVPVYYFFYVYIYIYICSCLWFSFLWSNCANMWSLNTIVQTTSNPSSIAVIHGDWWYLGSQNMLFE